MSTDTPSCGKSRFGCWVCTLVEQDKSMAAMIMNDSEKEWMTPLLDFRNHIGDPERDRERRDFRRMTGSTHLFRGRLVPGPYKKSVREDWLRMLLKIQKDINQNGPEEFRSLELIAMEELHKIRQIWLDEKHEFDDSLPSIYKEITGQDFVSSSDNAETSFGKGEWELLSDVCRDLFPNEELLFETTAHIVDIERKAVDLKKRRGVLGDIEAQIKRGFFKDEDDAFTYTVKKHQRKKDMGASYDPKAQAEDTQVNLFGCEEGEA
jgi:DNA sulfur modification protein DndC